MVIYRLTRDVNKCVHCGNCTMYLPKEISSNLYNELILEESLYLYYISGITKALSKCFLEHLRLEGPI